MKLMHKPVSKKFCKYCNENYETLSAKKRTKRFHIKKKDYIVVIISNRKLTLITDELK